VTQGQKKEAMLLEMRDRVTTEEAGLHEVLQGGNKELRKKFPEADRLLAEVNVSVLKFNPLLHACSIWATSVDPDQPVHPCLLTTSTLLLDSLGFC
jgi:hypothetical protein